MSYYSNFMMLEFGNMKGSPWSLEVIKRDRKISAVLAFALHALFFLAGGLVLVKPVQYAIDMGKSGIEVNLVAAPQEAVVEQKIEEVVPVQKAIIPEVVQAKLVKPVEEPKPIVKTVPEGKDKVTFRSEKGALTQAKPNYLKNPAPAYPWEARQKGWEGVVLLSVRVSVAGQVMNIEIEKTSGHRVLDESALKTVKTWRFNPAQLGNVPVESSVQVPIRFRLEDLKKK